MKYQTQLQLGKEPIEDIENKKFEYVYPRLGLKGCASQVYDTLVETIDEFIEDVGVNSLSNLEVMYSMYADGAESFFKINGEEMEGESCYTGDFFESLPEVMFLIHCSTSQIRGLNHSQADALYTHDFSDRDEPGEIEVSICLPENVTEIIPYLRSSRSEIIGLLVHEMQHAVQKLVYGVNLSGDTVEGLESHIKDIFEIDSRVEEIIGRMPEYKQDDDEVSFINELNKYVDQYLERNAKQYNSDSVEKLKDEMIESHINHYQKKIGNNNVS